MDRLKREQQDEQVGGSTPTAALTFIGTATTLIELGTFTLLTDPNFLHRGQRAYLGNGLWARRVTEPAPAPADLPPLDAVLLSHLHGDHVDRVARAELDRAAPVLNTPSAARRLESWGFDSAGIRPWKQVALRRGDERLDFLDRIRPRKSVPVHHCDHPVFRSRVWDFGLAAHAAAHNRVRVVQAGQRTELRSRPALPVLGEVGTS